MAIVSVEYPLVDGFIDDQLNKIAGKKSCSSGCWSASSPPQRDIQWEFSSKREATEVAKRMKCVKIVESVTVDDEEVTVSGPNDSGD